MLCERLNWENEMMKQQLNEKKSTLLNNYKDLEMEVEKQESIISLQNYFYLFL